MWEIIKDYWKNNNIGNDFIATFENEYIKKYVQWHYGPHSQAKVELTILLSLGTTSSKTFSKENLKTSKYFLEG